MPLPIALRPAAFGMVRLPMRSEPPGLNERLEAPGFDVAGRLALDPLRVDVDGRLALRVPL